VFVAGVAPLAGGPPFAIYITMGVSIESLQPKNVGCCERFGCANESAVDGG